MADITSLRTSEGWLYLAAIQDAYSRLIVGWWMATHTRSSLVVDALEMALARWRPDPGLIHDPDQGGHYVSLAFGRAAREAGIAVSMGSRGDAYDDAVAETFFATLEKELVNRRSWPSRLELQFAVFEYIEAFYNPPTPALHPETSSRPATTNSSNSLRSPVECNGSNKQQSPSTTAQLSREAGQVQRGATAPPRH